jgi:hypothetical protein
MNAESVISRMYQPSTTCSPTIPIEWKNTQSPSQREP